MTRAKDISKILTAPVFGGLTYPTTDGSSNQFMKTDGSGNLSFSTVTGTTINNNADNRIITGSGSANTLNGEANLTFDGTTLGLTGNQTISGTLGVTGAITGTLATAAQTNITSVGTLTTLTVDDITINGSTISDSSDFTLDVAGQINLDADSGNMKFRDGGVDIGLFTNDATNFVIRSEVSDKDLIFKGNDGGSFIEAMRIDMSEGGKVGIGTSSPDQKLTVNGHINLPTGNSYFYGAGHNVFQVDSTYTYFYGGTSGVQIRKSDNSTALVSVNDSGSVGIGTTPSQKLHVAGAGNQFIYLNNTTTSDSFYLKAGTGASSIQTGGGSSIMNFFTAGNERMRIDASGRVGIGSTALGANLNIAGASSDTWAASTTNGLALNGNASGVSTISTYADGSSVRIGSGVTQKTGITITGQTSGSGSTIQFRTGNSVRMFIHYTDGLIKYGELGVYRRRGNLAGQTALTSDISGLSGAGVIMVEVMYTHYSINSYGAARFSTLGMYGGSIISTHDIQNISSGNGGAWSFSTPSSGTLRVTKSAGTYIGVGHWWIRITTPFA